MHDLQAPDPHGTRRRDLRLSSEVQPKGFVLQSNGGLRAADQRLPFGNVKAKRTVVCNRTLKNRCGTSPTASATASERGRAAVPAGSGLDVVGGRMAPAAIPFSITRGGVKPSQCAGVRKHPCHRNKLNRRTSGDGLRIEPDYRPEAGKSRSGGPKLGPESSRGVRSVSRPIVRRRPDFRR